MRTSKVYDKFAARTPGIHKVTESIPWRETCFGCRDEAHGGLHIRAYYTEDDYVCGIARTDANHDGFPEVTHGGVLATYFDEVCWHQTKRVDRSIDAMTLEESVHFWHPVKQGEDIKIVAFPAEEEGRHYYVEGAILLSDGTIAATAKVHYLCIRNDNKIAEEEHVRLLHPSDAVLEEIYF